MDLSWKTLETFPKNEPHSAIGQSAFCIYLVEGSSFFTNSQKHFNTSMLALEDQITIHAIAPLAQF